MFCGEPCDAGCVYEEAFFYTGVTFEGASEDPNAAEPTDEREPE